MVLCLFPTAELFPATAGMNRWPHRIGVAGDPVPRDRGDEPSVINGVLLDISCSPRPRG